MKLTRFDYDQKAKALNQKFPSLKAEVNVSKFGGRLEIEVSSINKAQILNEMFPGYNFTSGPYK